MIDKDNLSGDTIVISGISGTYPQAKNIKHFEETLYKKINPITKSSSRWRRENPEYPEYVGQVPDIDRFDTQFFKIHNKLALKMDPMTNKLLEHSYQALFDAGMNPGQLKKQRVGVYVGVCGSDSEKWNLSDTDHINGYATQGSLKTMNANRISYYLDLKGPSATFDGACCSSLIALEAAFQAIKHGNCDAAIVGGTIACLLPQTSVLYDRTIGLSKDGKTKSFDKNGNGFVRSDSMNILFLQRAKDAKRVYAEICHVKQEFLSNVNSIPTGTNILKCDPQNLKSFLTNFYDNCNVLPEDVEYVEGVGCANQELDKLELEVMDEIFSKNRKVPLTVGSVMSNIGYTEAASGITGIMKVLLGYHKGKLAGNLHYEAPRQDLEAVKDGRLHILKDHQPFHRTYTAINNMSVTGIFAHVLLKGHYKQKDNNRYTSSIPYLVTLSGRREAAVTKIISELKSDAVDPEAVALLHNFHLHNVTGHLARGYVILDNQQTKNLSEKVTFFDYEKKPLWFVYSGMGSQWTGIATELMRMPIFAAAIEKCSKVLQPLNIDLVSILTSTEEKFGNILHSFLAITATQIGLTDILRQLGLVPDKIIGHSVGEFGCAYADGCMTAEEIILGAYTRGKVSLETETTPGLMAAVGLGHTELLKILPSEIDIACHNSPSSSTISGPKEAVLEFIKKLKAQNIFAKEVNTSNIAYHSRYIADAGPQFLMELKKIIREPKRRSPRWISTSVPQHKWNEDRAAYSSAEYHTDNLLGPVLFEEVLKFIPQNAVLVEIAPHGLLQAILKRSLPSETRNIPLMQRNHLNNVQFLLEAFGSLYLEGFNLNIEALYPKVDFPVSTETKYLSHLVEWIHDEKWPVPDVKGDIERKAACCIYKISVHDDEYNYLRGNSIQGRTTYPFAAALVSVWDTLAMYLGVQKKELSVKFNNVQLFEQPLLNEEEVLIVTASIHKGSGLFEVLAQNKVMASGVTYARNSVEKATIKLRKHQLCHQYHSLKITSKEIYDNLNKRDYNYSDDFKSIDKVNDTFTEAQLHWKDNWVTFIDGMLQVNALKRDHNGVSTPVFIREMSIDILEHRMLMNDAKKNTKKINLNDLYDFTTCGGIIMKGIKFQDYQKRATENIQTRKSSCGMNTFNQTSYKNHSVLQCANVGDIDSLHWINNQIEIDEVPTDGDVVVLVHYSSINVYDSKIASGVMPYNSKKKFFGMEFSGVNKRGERVMGIVENGAASSLVSTKPEFLWPVPKYWSLEDAATVPLAYVQAFYYLFIKLKLQHGWTILVHGGAGALGQAIISIALKYSCKVFTTVRDIHKKRFLLRLFPQLEEQNILYSRTTELSTSIKTMTGRKGCDVAIGCVSEKWKTTTIDSCGYRGVFLDLSHSLKEENYTFGFHNLNFERTYITADFTTIFNNNFRKDLKKIRALMCDGISRGYVRPLSRVTYAAHEAPRAFRLLAASKHRGRVLLKICEPLQIGYYDIHKANNIKIKECPNPVPPKGLQNIIFHVDFDEIRATQDVLSLPTLVSGEKFDEKLTSAKAYLCIMPGLEGYPLRFKLFSELLKIPAVLLQHDLGSHKVWHQQALINYKILLNKVGLNKTFCLFGYEYGVVQALEMAAVFENQGFTGTVFCLGGSPEGTRTMIKDNLSEYPTEQMLQEGLIVHLFSLMSGDDVISLQRALQHCTTWQERVDTYVQLLSRRISLSKQYIREYIESTYRRILTACTQEIVIKPLQSQIVHIRTYDFKKEVGSSLQRYSKQKVLLEDLNLPLSQATNDIRLPAIINKHLPKHCLKAFESKNVCELYEVNDNLMKNSTV